VAEVMANDRRGLSGATSPGVTLAERSGLEMVQVSAWPATSNSVVRILTEVLGVQPPEQPNTVASREQTKILSVGPYRWLIVRPAEHQRDLAAELVARLPTDASAVVELGAGHCVFAILGPRARDVLAKQLPLDLSESKFPAARCVRSAMAHISVLVHCEGKDALEVFVYRGFAQHLWEMLTDAALEFGLDVRAREVCR
jgi:heterotetrameric sarcosine oxidase gamma subunit